MSKANRGGLTLKTGQIGRVMCLRQQMMMPGERMNLSINGEVQLQPLKQRANPRLNAHMATFMTPLRWLWSDYTDYVKEGPDTSIVPPTTPVTRFDTYGVGAERGLTGVNMFSPFKDSLLRIYNEWYKWPESADITAWPDQGAIAVPLQKSWSRVRDSMTPTDGEDYNQISSSIIDVRELAETQAKFRGAMKREVLTYSRWIELVNEVFKGDGSREVDQVPIMLDQTEVGVSPRSLPATDLAGLGQWQALFDFNVNHDINGIVAPEHCIITTLFTIRFASVDDSGCHPLARADRLNWHELVGDPEWLASAQPQAVQVRDLQANNIDIQLGFLPAGWQWRVDHDVIGEKIDTLDNFAMMRPPLTATECRDATRIKDCFRSNELEDYLVELYFREDCKQPIGDAMDSYFSGMTDHLNPSDRGGKNDEFPHQGKML